MCGTAKPVSFFGYSPTVHTHTTRTHLNTRLFLSLPDIELDS